MSEPGSLDNPIELDPFVGDGEHREDRGVDKDAHPHEPTWDEEVAAHGALEATGEVAAQAVAHGVSGLGSIVAGLLTMESDTPMSHPKDDQGSESGTWEHPFQLDHALGPTGAQGTSDGGSPVWGSPDNPIELDAAKGSSDNPIELDAAKGSSDNPIELDPGSTDNPIEL